RQRQELPVSANEQSESRG
nr:immunoglobulin heavy chain junction region [Homo sapiens]